ncbi:MAG: hypothetical protein H5T96_04285 [Tissierellales bacterium]|nr:hypothetical protein [Tissierellales bacterium]
MDIIKDLLEVNKSSLLKSIKSIKSHWEALLIIFVYAIMTQIITSIVSRILVGSLSIISGFLIVLIEAAIVSSLLFVLKDIVLYNRFRWKSVIDGLNYYLWKVYGVLFILFVVNLILSLFYNVIGSAAFIINTLFQLFILIMLNPLPEIIYLKNYDPRDSLTYSIEFIRENFLNWIIPNIIFGLILFAINSAIDVTFFPFNLAFLMPLLLKNIFLSIIISFAMIYRGHLFYLLSTSTRRKRQYMNKF